MSSLLKVHSTSIRAFRPGKPLALVANSLSFGEDSKVYFWRVILSKSSVQNKFTPYDCSVLLEGTMLWAHKKKRVIQLLVGGARSYISKTYSDTA